MLLRLIVTFWLVPPPPKSPMRMPRVVPLLTKFCVIVIPSSPPPMTTCEPSEPGIPFCVTVELSVLNSSTPLPFAVMMLREIVMFVAGKAADAGPMMTAAFWLLLNVLLSMVTSFSGAPRVELIGVNRGAADRSGNIVVLEQVPGDDRLIDRTGVSQRQARDIVLNDIVGDLRTAGAAAPARRQSRTDWR